MQFRLQDILGPAHTFALCLSALLCSTSLSWGAPIAIAGHLHAPVAQASLTGDVDPAKPLDLVVVLRFRNQSVLDALAATVSDPKSPEYRHYLTPEDFRARFGPSLADASSVSAYLRSRGLTITGISRDNRLIHVRTTAGTAEKALSIRLQAFKTQDGRTFFAPASDPMVEKTLPIAHIAGLDNFRPLKRGPVLGRPLTPKQVQERFHRLPGAPSGTPASTGPFGSTDFRRAYLPDVVLTGRGQVVGLLVFEGYNSSDIALYETTEGTSSPALKNIYLDNFDGTVTKDTSVETSLDIEDAIAMAPGLDAVNIYGVPGDGYAIEAFDEMANPTQGEALPRQISTSYEIYYDQSIYDALKQFAVQGQTFFSASGDYGAYTPYTDQTKSTFTGPFNPADYKYVTSVGGTVLTVDAQGNWQSETGWDSSGGGPSPWAPDPEFVLPAWQNNVANAANKASTTARNVPDVAMPASNVLIAFNGSFIPVWGTSASSPLWAGFMALTNEMAAGLGRPPVGFANPAFYSVGGSAQYANAFHDITSGSNAHQVEFDNQGNVTRQGSNGDYNAVAGYDLVTGWGSPKGYALIGSLLNLRSVYRWYQPGIHDHFYTEDPTGEAAPNSGYHLEGIPFSLFDAGTSGTKAFYRWYCPNTHKHFYTTDPSGELAPSMGCQAEGILGYIATSQVPGTVPLYRWYQPSVSDHFYTTDAKGELAPASGYHQEMISGYVVPRQ